MVDWSASEAKGQEADWMYSGYSKMHAARHHLHVLMISVQLFIRGQDHAKLGFKLVNKDEFS